MPPIFFSASQLHFQVTPPDKLGSKVLVIVSVFAELRQPSKVTHILRCAFYRALKPFDKTIVSAPGAQWVAHTITVDMKLTIRAVIHP